MTVSATLTSRNDGRVADRGKYPVWEVKATLIWQTGDGHAAQTVTIPKVNGVVENVIAVISSVTANPTVDITLLDENGVEILGFDTLADGTTHVKKYPSDLDSVLLPGTDLTLSVDPSADAGGADQTLTVTVILRGL